MDIAEDDKALICQIGDLSSCRGGEFASIERI